MNADDQRELEHLCAGLREGIGPLARFLGAVTAVVSVVCAFVLYVVLGGPKRE